MILTNNLWHVFYLFKLSGDIEENPVPKLNFSQKLSICHWNLNSIEAHNFIKVSLLIAYNSIHKYDIIYSSKTYLDASTVLGDDVTIPLTLNVDVFVFITNRTSL